MRKFLFRFPGVMPLVPFLPVRNPSQPDLKHMILRMTTLIKAEFKKLDIQTNIDKLRVATLYIKTLKNVV